MTDRETKIRDSDPARLPDLESTLSRFARRGPAPVDLWNPENCGTIGLRIGADGTWFYGGSPIGRKALVRLFSTILRKDPDGLHYLVTPVEKIVVEVADAPFLAVEMVVTGEGRDQKLLFRTNVDDEVAAGPGNPLRFERDAANDGIKPYILVRGALEALVTRSLTYDLVNLARIDRAGNTDRFGIWSSGAFFAVSPSDGIMSP